MHSVKHWTRPDGKRLLRYASTRVMGDSEHEVELVDLAAGTTLFTLESENLSVVPGRSGAIFLTMEWGKLDVRSTETGAVVCALDGSYRCYATDPRDRRVVAADARAVVVEVATGRRLCDVEGTTGALDADGARLAVRVGHTPSRRVAVYEVETGVLIWRAKGLEPWVSYVFFSADGRHVVAESEWTERVAERHEWRTARAFFDAATGRQLAAEELATIALPSLPERGVTLWGHSWPGNASVESE